MTRAAEHQFGRRRPTLPRSAPTAHKFAPGEQLRHCQLCSTTEFRPSCTSARVFCKIHVLLYFLSIFPASLEPVDHSFGKVATVAAAPRANDSLGKAVAVAADHPHDPTDGVGFQTGKALSYMRKSVGHDVALAVRRVQLGGAKAAQSVSKKTAHLWTRAKNAAHEGYKNVKGVAEGAARAVSKAAGGTKRAAGSAWKRVKGSPADLRRVTGKATLRIGQWMLDEDGRE